MELQKRIFLLITGDTLAAMLAILTAIAIQQNMLPAFEDVVSIGVSRIALFILILVFLSFLAEIYKNHHELVTSDIAFKIVFSLGVACLVFAVISYAHPDDPYGNSLLVSAIIAFGFFQFLCHVTYRLYVKFKGFARRVLILGVGPLAGQMGAIIPASDENYILSGYVQCANEPSQVPTSNIVGNGGGCTKQSSVRMLTRLSYPFPNVAGCFPCRKSWPANWMVLR